MSNAMVLDNLFFDEPNGLDSTVDAGCNGAAAWKTAVLAVDSDAWFSFQPGESRLLPWRTRLACV